MTATLTFEPLPDSSKQQHFERTEIDLHVENQVYLVGFTKHPLAPPRSDAARNNSEDESAVTRDGLRSRYVASRHLKTGAATTTTTTTIQPVSDVSDVGFAEGLVDRKLCIVPVPDKPAKVKELARNMGTMYAAIWLAPGYKMMLLPAEGSKVYYQRAFPGNPRWRKISKGYGIDLADPLMTVLDNAIHIKIDIRPDEPPASASLLNKVVNFIEWYKKYSKPSGIGTTSSSPAPVAPPRLIDNVHTEITGTKVYDPRRSAYQVAARVSVLWEPANEELKEQLRVGPERGSFHELRAQREKAWKEKEMEIEKLGRMGLEVNPFANAGDTNTTNDEESNLHEQPFSPSAVGEADDNSEEEQVPSIPEQPHESKQGTDNDPGDTSARPSRGRSKSNTAKSPPQSREASPDSKRSKDSRGQESGRRSRSPSRVPAAVLRKVLEAE